jgi:peptidoglycan/LPS O-acetylase OafA/YrhL
LKSSSGRYYIGLDHIKAVALFTVFTWHFIHVDNGHHAAPPVFPLSILTEGHTGVALFMVLSGYLYAKLLNGKDIVYRHFIWNRFLRLVPLLLIVIIIAGFEKYLEGKSLTTYAQSVILGIVTPTLPNGGWSVTVEFHLYLILPVLLFLNSRWKYSLPLVLVTAVLIRALLYQVLGQIQLLSYWTIIGRIDQFIAGILAYQFRRYVSGRHLFALCVLLTFFVFYWYFDSQGGFYEGPSCPSPNPIWIYIPTIEGLAYASLTAWYYNSFRHSTGRLSRFVALIGRYSYSIFLLHYFVVNRMSDAIDSHIVDLSNLHLAILFSAVCFPFMIPIGHLTRLSQQPIRAKNVNNNR